MIDYVPNLISLHDLLVKGKSKLCFSNSPILGIHTRVVWKEDPPDVENSMYSL